MSLELKKSVKLKCELGTEQKHVKLKCNLKLRRRAKTGLIVLRKSHPSGKWRQWLDGKIEKIHTKTFANLRNETQNEN